VRLAELAVAESCGHAGDALPGATELDGDLVMGAAFGDRRLQRL